jgi:DNA primase
MALGNVSLTPQLVQAVRDAVDVVQIASEHTRLRKAGRRYQGLCPIHREKTPSFSVDPDQGLFYCFGCGAGGDAIKLHMLLTGDDFPAAIEALALRHGIPLPTRTEGRKGPGGRDEGDLERALQAAAEFFVDQLGREPVPRDYLARRRIPGELIVRFGLGYAPDGWRNLVQALHPRVPLADLVAAGLAGRNERGEAYDRFRHRLMFPIHNAAGRLVGFGGRTLGDDKAKYVNTAETDRFHKGLLLYGLHQAKREIRESGRAVLVEGYFDVIGAVASGVEGAVAGMGTALTPEQAKLLGRYAEEVVVAYDGDNAGENAFRRALPLLLAERLAVRRARFPEGHDPDSLRLAEGEEAVQKGIEGAADAVTQEIERLVPPGTSREPQLQAKAAAAIAELLRPIPDAILRFGYGRVAAGHLDVPVEMLARRLGVENPKTGSPAAPGGAEVKKGEGGEGVRGAPREVRSLEEQVLEHLFQREGQTPLPAAGELPPPEVFFDPACRNIYRAFCTLYSRGRGVPPDARAVQAELGPEGDAIDRIARVVLEGNFVSGRIGLPESLDKLTDRWRRQRLQELQREIIEADRRGDRALLERLMEEKLRLSRYLHRSSRSLAGGEWS